MLSSLLRPLFSACFRVLLFFLPSSFSVCFVKVIVFLVFLLFDFLNFFLGFTLLFVSLGFDHPVLHLTFIKLIFYFWKVLLQLQCNLSASSLAR